MAMKLKHALTAAPRGLLRHFSTTSTPSFSPTPTADGTSARQKADPNTNLFVSGLNKRTTTEKLKEHFSQFGEVVQAKVVTDRVSGYSKGFGFVQYATLDDAAKGIEGTDGKFLEGWVIFSEYAKPRPSPAASGNNPRATTPYGNNGNSSYGNRTGIDRNAMHTSATYGTNSSPAYGNNSCENTTQAASYGNNTGSAYRGSNCNNACPTYETNSGPPYGNATGPAYGNSSHSGYGSNVGPSHWGTSGTPYTSGVNPGSKYENHRGQTYGSNSVPLYEEIPQGNSSDPYGDGMGAAYDDKAATGYGRR